MVRRVHIMVSGRVQGVWFRGSTARVASALGLVGWARNLADGRVEIRAQGPSGKLDEFIAWCRIGPPRASVETIEVREEAPGSEFATFEVRRP